MNTVDVATAAWFGDRTLRLTFPPAWDVEVVGGRLLSAQALDVDALRDALRAPVGTARLSELARRSRNAVIVIDDISRPTPTAELLPLVLDELQEGGMPPSRVRIVIAAGSHAPASVDENLRKVGAAVHARVPVDVHDADGDLVEAGRSPSGIPLQINRTVMAADLRIGIGSIAPHDAAGFSGGSKIIVPGVAGTATARFLHDFLRGARARGIDPENEFRRELDAIARMLGLDFIVNVLLNHRRHITALFAGDAVHAHRAGASLAAELFAVAPVADADIVVANSYPYDANLWFVPWGFWPLDTGRAGASRVVLADGSQGAGGHRLKPTHRSFIARAWLRLLTLRPGHLGAQLRHLVASLSRTRKRRALPFLLLCPKASAAHVAQRFAGATHFVTWDDLLAELRRRHGDGRVKVAVYPCAPLQYAREAADGR